MRPDRRRRRALAALLFALAAPPALALELDDLMHLLQQRRSGEARFTEQRFVSGLDQTLRFSGTLSFSAPDRLARHTLSPRPESFVVEGNQLTLERGGRTRALALDAQPELAAMVTAMRDTLSGDASALRQHFKPAVRGSRAQWSLTLVPLEYRLLGVVREVRIDGRLADVQTVEVQLADGDRSVMTIEPIGPPRPRGAPP
jgi:Outer membrane lipoprotein carrier protein LolA-like